MDEESEEQRIEEASSEEPAPAAPPQATAATAPVNPVTSDPYEFGACTIAIQIMLLPDDGNEHGREVVIGVRNHQDVPIIRAFRLDEVPLASPITNLLEELRDDLQVRAVAHKLREAEKAAKQAASTARSQVVKPPAKPAAAAPEPPKAAPVKQVGKKPTDLQMSFFS